MLPCLNKQLLGFDCFGCGIQRAFFLILKGEFSVAFKMYPAIYPLIVLTLFLCLNFFFKFKRANKIINILAVTSVATILVSFTIKLINQ
ncbi:DUF2752 domain-containing protein [Mangrovimonas spongiae]|uniref:DUF2752 domain-containing protein n=1 Tax=Mangrovimonas spongiae TaxID=2494697 RepID=A0A428JVZ0_9FLAO|nr:DUF2752 domain-containing protein [Mangrovimonas spongiae]RSK38323.1 DUF2752 domain-containing protein [Mangrovimonas spongiae]